MSKTEKLLNLARQCATLAVYDLSVTYERGQGYRLWLDRAPYARFRTFAAGQRWLSDLARDHIPNWPNLRWGTPFQRGKFQETPK